jgi:hypothetical protein
MTQNEEKPGNKSISDSLTFKLVIMITGGAMMGYACGLLMENYMGLPIGPTVGYGWESFGLVGGSLLSTLHFFSEERLL